MLLQLIFRLFELAPYLQALFPFADEELSESSETFQKHALQVMETVDTAVTLILANDISTLEGALIDLGMVHNFKNVKPEHFAVSKRMMYILAFRSTLQGFI